MHHAVMGNKKWDALLGAGFGTLTLAFLAVFMTNDGFFQWAFERHHNLLSWYVRPVFILPIAYFAFKRSWAGVMGSVFCLFTSMFWFPAPAEIDPSASAFLAFEMEYLKGAWTPEKAAMSLLVPLFFVSLIWAAWRHSLKALIGVIVAAAVLKVLWSAFFAGDSGLSVVKPAVLGLLICVGLVLFYQKKKSGK